MNSVFEEDYLLESLATQNAHFSFSWCNIMLHISIIVYCNATRLRSYCPVGTMVWLLESGSFFTNIHKGKIISYIMHFTVAFFHVGRAALNTVWILCKLNPNSMPLLRNASTKPRQHLKSPYIRAFCLKYKIQPIGRIIMDSNQSYEIATLVSLSIFNVCTILFNAWLYIIVVP